MNRVDLPPLSVVGRIPTVEALLESAGCDALVVSNPVNIRWCTGFTGSAGVLLIKATGSVLLTDGRYREQAGIELGESGCDADVEITRHLIESGAARLEGIDRVGLEADSVTWAQQREWSTLLADALVATTTIVDGLRQTKDEAEIARMEVAARAVDDALADVVDLMVAGTTERELAAAIDAGMRERGAEGPAYDTIVATGANSALPHATPGDRVLCSGDLLVVDAGAVVEGYRSDMTRTFVVGGEPSDPRVSDILDLVARAQQAAVDRVAPDVVIGDIDRTCREIIESAGYGECFAHGTGHGVGLDIHELPAVGKGNTGILQQGHVLTVEPGIYITGLGGVRIEDTVVVTSDGCRALTRFPKQTTP